MQKSKSWLKSLLIVVLAIMLVFSLVACNKGGNDNNDPVDESAADYFNALWSATKPIGTTAIANNADLSVSFGFELSVDTINEKSNSVYQQIDLGFDVHAVIGRTEQTANNTAIKLRLYDPTDANYEEILTLYAFASDLDNLYIDFAGKNIKLPHNLESLIWTEILGMDGKVSDGIISGLNAGIVTIGDQKKSINELINMFTGDFGADWSLNSIIDRVLSILNFDANKIIEFIQSSGVSDIITSLVGVDSVEDLLDNGKLDILKILTSDTVGQILNATRQKVGDAVIHKIYLSEIISTVLGFMDGQEIASMIFPKGNSENGGEVSLSFTEKNGAIDDLTIYAQLLGLSVKLNPNTDDELPLVPEISLKITEFNIEALAADKSNGVALKADKNYSDTIAFDETVELAANGIKVLALKDGGKDISLNGKIIINAKGQLDIVNTNAVIAANEAITENKTKANVTVTLVNRDQAPKTIAEISYANGKIVGKVADDIDLSFIMEELEGKHGFVYDLGSDFNVADMVQGHIRKIVEHFIPDEDEGGASVLPAPVRSLDEKVKAVLENALAMVTTPDNHLHIETANILATVVNFKESVNPGSGTSTNPGPDKWTEENRIVAIVNSLLNPPNADKTMDECITILEEQYEVIKADDENTDWEAVFDTCKDAALRILYLVAQNVRIAGVQTENLNAANYAAFKKPGATEADTKITAEDTALMIYINNIKAVLATQIIVDGDLQGGIHSSVSVNIADATMSVSTSFELVENATFYDLFDQYVKDVEDEDATKADAWYIFE